MSHPFAILHVPHASTEIPADLQPALLLAGDALAAELLLMTDWHTDRLFALPEAAAATVRFPVSRLVVDPERFLLDAQEPMSRRGMGAIYTRTSAGECLRPHPTALEREALLRRYYRPHHEALARAVESALATHGRCLVLDAHSFPSQPLAHESDQSPQRPEVCIGTDAFHTPEWLAEAALVLTQAAGYQVELDRPFTGALVPSPHYGQRPEVLSLMIEVNRSLYIDEASGVPLPSFEQVRARVVALMTALIECAQRGP